jgi:hypothetical protein
MRVARQKHPFQTISHLPTVKSADRQRMLSQLASSFGDTLQVLSLNPHEDGFQLRVKNPLARPRPKHRLRDGSGLGSLCAHRLRDDSLTELDSLCMDEMGVRGFSRSA